MPDYVEEFLRYLSVDRGRSPRTVETYRGDLHELVRFLLSQDQTIDWRLVDRDRIRLWVASRMQAGVKPQTIKRSLSSLRSFFRYMLMVGAVERNPMSLISNPKVPHPLPAFLRPAEMDQLLDHTKFPETFAGRRDHLILLTFYSCGLRISELCGMNVADVDLDRSELRVLGKRNKHRVVPFGEELHAAFVAYLPERAQYANAADPAFFISEKGPRLSAEKVRQMVKSYLSLVTTQHKRTPHVLRHTFATAMLNAGADLEAVKDLLGHESVATTQIYTHTTFEELRKAYAHAHPREKEK